MQVKDKTTTFKSGGFYNLTAQVQENTVLNRGLLDIGGYAVPQMIMSNNKDEKIERGILQGLYFVNSFLAPFVLLPFFNKTFLRKDFSGAEQKIIEVSKKYLTKDADFVTGIRETAIKIEQEAQAKGKKLNVKQDFENILNRYDNKQVLKDKLLSVHEKVFMADFLATGLMWCATPWAATEVTKYRTHRSGYSATYEMIDEKQSKINTRKEEDRKKKKLLYSALIGIIPAIIFPKLVTKGLKSEKGLLSVIKKIPQNFNYNKGMFPSKTIFGVIWILCDYPSSIISARDKYERRDRAIRGLASLVAFFGGDFFLNNILGRLSDSALKTKIMEKPKANSNFLKKMLLKPKSFTEIENLKDVAPKILKRTKNIGAGLYWITLVANMAFCGFTVPVVLNKMLKKSVKKDIENSKV